MINPPWVSASSAGSCSMAVWKFWVCWVNRGTPDSKHVSALRPAESVKLKPAGQSFREVGQPVEGDPLDTTGQKYNQRTEDTDMQSMSHTHLPHEIKYTDMILTDFHRQKV